MHIRVLLVFLVVLFVTICQSRAEERKLKVNDSIQLIVFGEASLGATVRIDSSGSVNFPLIGNVEVVGKSAGEVAQQVEMQLEKDYIRDANVTVTVVQEFIEVEEPEEMAGASPDDGAIAAAKPIKSSVTILGEVKAPGTVFFDGTTADILTVMAQVRGFTQLANTKKVTVRRVGDDGGVFTVNVDELTNTTEQFFLKSGDSVTVPKRLF